MAEFIDTDKLKQIVEASLMAADEPLTVDALTRLFAHGELDSEEGRAQIRETLTTLESEAEGRGYELKRVASGYRYQVRQELSEWVSRLWEEKPPRYSRALLETLALIAYKQPVTRGDIEQVRGVSVSQNIMRTLQERGWIRVVGQREVPGKPSLYGTTRQFLDYFNLKSLDQLPPLTEIRSLIEPLVIEEVAEEARQVAEHDHPELMNVETSDAGTADGGEEPSAGDKEPSAGDKEPSAGDKEPSAGNNEPSAAAAKEPSNEEPSGNAGQEETDQQDVYAHHTQERDEARPRAEGEDGAEGQGDSQGQSRTEERSEDEDQNGEGPDGGGSGEQPHSAEVVRLPTSPRR